MKYLITTIFAVLFATSSLSACIITGGNKAQPASDVTASNYIVFLDTGLQDTVDCTLDAKFPKDFFLNTGQKYYADRDHKLVTIPAKYIGMTMIQTLNNDRNNSNETYMFISPDKYPVTIYIGYDSRITTLPSWMSKWKDTGDVILTSLATQKELKIYRRKIMANVKNKYTLTEASKNADGTDLKDLSHSLIYYKKSTEPDIVYRVRKSAPATSPTGGGTVRQGFYVLIEEGEIKLNVDLWATHVDTSKNESDPSIPFTWQINLDPVSPAPPENIDVPPDTQ